MAQHLEPRDCESCLERGGACPVHAVRDLAGAADTVVQRMLRARGLTRDQLVEVRMPTVENVVGSLGADERAVLCAAINRMAGEQRPWCDHDSASYFTAAFAVKALEALVLEQAADLQPDALAIAVALRDELAAVVA